ncbi:hypothetical protein E2C01_040634 [Portunus trituberculatus]|uniref:Uncharacterized protein n=1 Tax=Portunus trituberculatus TaxID=210409 RepID=A0A5B7FPA5_PORTR|nr:hypothetical protein [Portunus trituberculatus]
MSCMSPARQEVTSVLDPEERGTLQKGGGGRRGMRGACAKPSTAAGTKLWWSYRSLPHMVCCRTLASLKPLSHRSSEACSGVLSCTEGAAAPPHWRGEACLTTLPRDYWSSHSLSGRRDVLEGRCSRLPSLAVSAWRAQVEASRSREGPIWLANLPRPSRKVEVRKGGKETGRRRGGKRGGPASTVSCELIESSGRAQGKGRAGAGRGKVGGAAHLKTHTTIQAGGTHTRPPPSHPNLSCNAGRGKAQGGAARRDVRLSRRGTF